MSDETYQNELRFKSGSNILRIIERFSATEKAIFGALVVLAGVAALLMAARVSDHFRVEVPAYGGELREGIVGLPRTINPVLAITDADRDLSALIYSGLMKYDGQKIVPDLAQSYSVSDDGLTYDFKLRPDARFQDGAPLTTDDIEFTLQKIQDPVEKSPRYADWANVTVNKVSSNEIKFKLKQAYSPFLSNMTIGILPKHIWSKISSDQFIFSQYNIEPVGSGPFKVFAVARNSGGIPEEYKLSAWNGYYGKKPFLSSIVFDFFADADKAVNALKDGKIDSLASIPQSEAAQMSTTSPKSRVILKTPLPRAFSAFFNQNQATIFQDKAVRQALDEVVDKSAIIKSVLNGYGFPLNGPLPAAFGLSAPYEASGTPQSALSAAQALLENAGWKKDLTGIYAKKATKSALSLSFEIYTADSEDLKQTAQYLKGVWSDLGAQVGVKTFSQSDLYQNVIRPRKYDILLFGQQIGKDRDLYAFWHSSQRNSPGLNAAMYANAKVDGILEDIRSANDDKKRADDYAQLDRLIAADEPAVFLYSPDFIYAIPERLKGVSLNFITVPSDRFNSVSNWYIDTEKVWKLFAKN